MFANIQTNLDRCAPLQRANGPTHLPPELSTDSDGGIVLLASDQTLNPTVRKPSHEILALGTSEHVADAPIVHTREGLDWCDRGFHVDFDAQEQVPLQRGRFLGYGVQGGVYETFCKGIALAWKTRYCRKKESQATQRREIEVLKRLDHRHVVRLVGSYTQGPELGLLIWPVAICDLGAFMDDIDTLHGNMSRLEMPDDDDCRQVLSIGGRFDVLCHRNDCATTAHGAGIARLLASFGCLIGAIRYIHDQKVRHKDIKPQNILLSHDGLWLADFGISSDFSTLSSSETETGERGTFRYCAPEVASYARSGRPADIFSLGCIFLEMLALVKGVRLAELRAHCPEHRGAFHKNLKHQQTWFTLLKTRVPHLQHLLCEVENMLEERPHRRPTAPTLESRFWIINKLANTSSTPLYDPCCEFEQVTSEIPRLQSEIRELKEQIDQLRGSPHNTDLPSYSTLPPPPMGPNLGAVVLSAQTTHHSNSNSNPREKCSRTRRKQADMPVRWS